MAQVLAHRPQRIRRKGGEAIARGLERVRPRAILDVLTVLHGQELVRAHLAAKVVTCGGITDRETRGRRDRPRIPNGEIKDPGETTHTKDNEIGTAGRGRDDA
jgi:hypothetical protein